MIQFYIGNTSQVLILKHFIHDNNQLVSNAPINHLMSLANMYNIDPFINSFCEFKIDVNLALR